ncbi:MAG: hypothetical protein RLZZ182_771 [Pseudomonadota bacterium]|jgi:outer membrane protein OmpA-like peptidoglycan-associated protein
MTPTLTLRHIAAALALAVAVPAFAQVKYFDRPPTPDEIRAALRGSPAPTPGGAPGTRSLSGGAKTRAIEWNSGATPPSASAQQVEQTVSGGAAAFTGGGQSAGASAFAGGAASGGTAIAVPVNFDSGSARISANSMGYIQAIAQAMAADPALRLVIEGHTDGVGNPQSNMMLSWDRAYSVFRTLVEKYGIDPARLQPLGKGSTEPMQGTSPMDGNNRRVQFRTLG